MIKDIQFLVALFADARRQAPRLVLRTQFFQLASAFWTSVISIIAFTTFYVLEKGTLSVLGHTYEIEATNFVLVTMFIALGICLCAQSVFFYLENSSLNRLCRVYEEKNVARAIRRIRSIGVSDLAEMPGRLDRPSALRAMQTDARFAANTQRVLQRAPVPIVMMLFGVAVLARINPTALIAVLLFTLAAAVPFVILSRRASVISHNFERSAARLTQTKRSWLDKIILESGHSADQEDEDDDAHFRELASHTSMREFMSLFEERVNILSQSTAIGGLISSVAVAIVTGIFAWEALNGMMPWSFVILHFASLQFIFRAVSRTTGLAVSANRFRTQIQRYFDFTLGGMPPMFGKPAPKTASKPSVPAKLPVKIHLPDAKSKRKTFTIAPGRRSFVIANSLMDRFEVYRFVLSLGYNDNPTLHFLNRPHFVTIEHIDDAVPSEDDLSEPDRSTADPDIKEIIGEDGQPDSRTARFIHLVLTEAAASTGVIFIDQRAMVLLDAAQVDRLLKRLEKLHVFFYATRTVQRTKSWGVQEALLFDGTSIRALGSVSYILKNRIEFLKSEETETDPKATAMGTGDDDMVDL